MNQPAFPGFAPTIERSAEIDPTGQYRYQLARTWGEPAQGHVNWIMLNPSTADGQYNDRTICRRLDFTRSWGYGGLVVTNLFAYRSTDPQSLFAIPNPVGPENDVHLANAVLECELVVLAWGLLGWVLERAAQVLLQFAQLDVRCHSLGVTRNGEPRHPLFLKKITEPQPFDIRRKN